MEKENSCSNENKVVEGIATHGIKHVTYNVLGNIFQVPSKYVPPIKHVGTGAYGIVW